jgi:hypothetical protein
MPEHRGNGAAGRSARSTLPSAFAAMMPLPIGASAYSGNSAVAA